MRTVVGVLRGGPSSEYDVSLKSGATVLRELDTQLYEPRDIFISRGGDWHLHGVAVSPEQALFGVDVAWNAIHGEYGEDGQLHHILDGLGVPYTGSDALASKLAFNKQHTKELLKKSGIKVAHGVVVAVPQDEGEREQLAVELFRTMPHPSIVKPVIGGSSVGVMVADNFYTLAAALAHASQISPEVLVEELIRGKEATVGVIDGFRGQKTYALMPVEIIPPPKRFFDYEVKYNGATEERVPGNFSTKEKAELERVATLAHELLGAAHYSRSDFIVSKRGIYFLELNSAQAVGLTEQSLLPKALYAAGAKLSEFISHVVELARRKK
ncbi:ATP-grasp domain-containing protein [Candidatus Kaiserbacteria bacterium]|nr:ATP-grasp domain-containing protein [Candidatus Kaiserbacteria bacterium]